MDNHQTERHGWLCCCRWYILYCKLTIEVHHVYWSAIGLLPCCGWQQFHLMLILIQSNLHIATCVSCFVPAENTRSLRRVGTFSVGNLLSEGLVAVWFYGILIRYKCLFSFAICMHATFCIDYIQFDLSGPSALDYNYCIPDMTFWRSLLLYLRQSSPIPHPLECSHHAMSMPLPWITMTTYIMPCFCWMPCRISVLIIPVKLLQMGYHSCFEVLYVQTRSTTDLFAIFHWKSEGHHFYFNAIGGPLPRNFSHGLLTCHLNPPLW